MLWSRKRRKRNIDHDQSTRRSGVNDSRRPIWGFPCSPDIVARMKMLAGRLNVPLYALTEHALQLSAGLISKMADNPKECEILREHLLEIHVAMRTIEKIRRLDDEMAEILDKEREQKLDAEQAVRQIVRTFVRRGLRPKEIAWAIDYGMRCRIALARKQPMPTDQPPDED